MSRTREIFFSKLGRKSRTQAAVMIASEINLSLLLISGFGFRHRTANAIAKLLFTRSHWLEQMTLVPGLRILLLPACFCDAKAANFVLEGRTF